jgi:hypothetical protein
MVTRSGQAAPGTGEADGKAKVPKRESDVSPPADAFTTRNPTQPIVDFLLLRYPWQGVPLPKRTGNYAGTS